MVNMLFSLLSTAALLWPAVASPVQGKITPRVFIFSMFEPETTIWWDRPEFDLKARNISLPGLSPIYPDVHCTPDGDICQLTTGESEINAASSVTALALSPLFDLRETYFLVAGIAGISPEQGTTGAVTFARFAIQVALQYEIDIRELPDSYTTGYIPQGAYYPGEYPTSIYGTEVFEVNANLRSLAASFARTANLSDSATAISYRANYNTSAIYQAAINAPSVLECDVATSDVYYSGLFLGEAFDNTTTLLTNGTGVYCSTAQEDNASLEALLRAAVYGLVDFARIIVMRTASDFDRPYPGEGAAEHLLYSSQGGYEPAVENIYLAGIKVVEGILDGWDHTFKKGVAPDNYIGDIFGTLGGTPDFGPGRVESLIDAGVLRRR
ncbi:hypothetical protein ASPZODRAFT_124807 [Penicilliopsis zonata CBS 506.65]|uniref:Purine nucleoside permease n=1 Tax=Penicilliopsis zonata CBS 506.65 TaxID=1073090 RepID=A0A1L9S6P5_9EURO|nr:hypothetical protein ASPZODRAFT_124807 [Penicilliopsis zonata CBS 506.65]OJJ42820.1 hypothetical protein ASPZODRAFT_124807 [Penicilliopsis zonata CBS 506.65]